MKIFYDHQIFSYQKVGGISKYFSELYANLINIADINIKLGLKINVNYYLKSILSKTNEDIKTIRTNNVLYKYFIYKINNKFSSSILRNNNYDILHSTFYDPYTLQYNKKKHVITVHDMIPELYSKYFKGTIYSYLITRKWIWGKKQLIEKADKIISVSQKTKEDLIKVYKVPESKIEVIYHGYNNLPDPSEKLISEPYILYIGLRDKYKNFVGFVKGVSQILKKEKIKVLCIGGGKFTNNEKQLLEEYQVEKYFIQKYVNDSELASAYRHALCFVYPSEYEGFGMPILEAFSQCCPTILSDSSCFPEIGGDAVQYFKWDNSEEMKEKILDVINSSNIRQMLIEKGRKRLELFSWGKSSGKHYEVYKNILREC